MPINLIIFELGKVNECSINIGLKKKIKFFIGKLKSN